MIPALIRVRDYRGEVITLKATAADIVIESENYARHHGITKRMALPLVFKQHIAAAGGAPAPDELAQALQLLESVRDGKHVEAIDVFSASAERNEIRIAMAPTDSKKEVPVTVHSELSFFELEMAYPSEEAAERYQRLMGIDGHKQRLLVELQMLLFPERLEIWSKKHHKGGVIRLCGLQQQRAALILLTGDVGTGKTALSLSVGDALAKATGGKVHLLKVNTQVRGAGFVGQMSDLIVKAFTEVENRARRSPRDSFLLLIDEADALAARRDSEQMHHEDKAGVNTLLQRIDDLKTLGLKIAVVFITNRPEALDPAIRRRAALSLDFERPNDEIRKKIIQDSVPELELTPSQLKDLAQLTSASAEHNNGVSYTASDLAERMLPGALRRAFIADRALSFEDLIAEARENPATPRMGRN